MLKLVSLKVDGFKNLKNCHLNFPPEGNILVTGKNESGKSTLFEAIFFALTSDLLVQDKRGYNDAIAFDKNSATIDFIFQKNGIPARIQKKISRTTTGTTVNIKFWENYEENDDPVSGKTTEMDDRIEEFLGFDDQILLNSAFVQQKGLEGFMDQTRRDRKEILNKMLNLEKISELTKKYKKDLKKKETIEYYLKNHIQIGEANQNIGDLTICIEKEKELLKEIGELKGKTKTINHLISEGKDLEKTSKETSDKINEKKKALSEKEAKKKEIKEFKELNSDFEDINNQIEKSESRKKIVSKDLINVKEKYREIGKDLDTYYKNRKALITDCTALKNTKELLDNFQKIKNEISLINDLEKEIEKKDIEINNFEEKIKEKQRAYK
ncbi:MAG: AAA family ATPase, partial [Minisyncoccales bacterium]